MTGKRDGGNAAIDKAKPTEKEQFAGILKILSVAVLLLKPLAHDGETFFNLPRECLRSRGSSNLIFVFAFVVYASRIKALRGNLRRVSRELDETRRRRATWRDPPRPHPITSLCSSRGGSLTLTFFNSPA